MGKPYKIKHHKRIYRRSAGSIILRVLIIAAAVAVLFGLGWALYAPVSSWIGQRQNQNDLTVGTSEQTPEAPTQQAGEEIPAEAPPTQAPQTEPQETDIASMTAYLPIETVAEPQQFEKALQSAADAGYDSIMFDLKTADGTVNYAISYDELTDARVTRQNPIDLNAVAEQIRQAGLIPVASIWTFRDNLYPSANNAASTYYQDSDFLWVDNSPEKGGKPWINPFSQAGQDYIRKIVEDACAAGFQSIVLQGVQFPEGYALDMIDYGEHASEDKHAFLKTYLSQMTEYAAEKGVELMPMFSAPSMLGANNAMYFGDTSDLSPSLTAVDLRLSVFGNGLNTDSVSIPEPSVNAYNTIKTASAAVCTKLPDGQLVGVLDGKELSESELSSQVQGASEGGIKRCIIVDPTF